MPALPAGCGAAAGVVVIGGRVAHRVVLTVAELPGPRLELERMRDDSSRLNGGRHRVVDCYSGDCNLRYGMLVTP